MTKKICLLFLLACFLCQFAAVLPVSAAPLSYTPGDVTMTYTFEEAVSCDRASIENGVLKLEAGGSAAFDVLLRADMVKAEIAYEPAGAATLTLSDEKESYSIPLAADRSTVTADVALRRGSHVMKLSSDAAVTITSVTFTKASQKTGIMAKYLVALDDYDTALQTTVVVKDTAVALKASGAMRYINYDNVHETAVNLGGTVYLPIQTAARALSVYYEDYPDLSYAYLSDDNVEIYSGSKGHYMIHNGKKTDIDSFVVYQNGQTLVPLRRMAEAFGKTVGWREGYVVIDDRICVKNIIENDGIFNRLKEEFAPYEVQTGGTGRTFHVSQKKGASDSLDGSADHPFATISRAAEVAQAGDTVIIHEGTYRETVTPQHDGTATKPIVYKAAEGENVTISAFDEVKDFVKYDDTRWLASVKSIGYDRNFIIYGDEILREGRHPNTDTKIDGKTGEKMEPHPGYDGVMRATMGNICIPEKNRTIALSDTDLNQDAKNYWKGGTFITLVGEAWTLSYAQITGSEKGKLYLQDHKYGKGSYGIAYYAHVQPSDYGYITHHINTVDTPGEWYINDETDMLILYPPEGADMETFTVEAKQRQRVIDLTNRKYVQFVGIHTRGGGLTMAGDSEMCVLNGGTHKYISQFDWSAAHVTHTVRMYEPDSTAQYDKTKGQKDAPEMGEAGFFAHGHNNAFINANIEYSAAAGIYLTGTYTYVENCVVAHTSYMGTYPSGITVEGVRWDEPTAKYGGHTIVGNTSYGAGRACMYLSRNYSHPSGDPQRGCLPILACDIGYNHFYYGDVTARDTGCIYFHGTTGGNDWNKTRVHHNVTHDNCTISRDSFMSTLYYFDGNANMNQCYSNVAFATYDGYMSDNNSAYFLQSGDATAQVDMWGNVSLGLRPEGVNSITQNDYPYNKPFYAGAQQAAAERFMLNYEQYSLESKLADEGTLGGSAYMNEDDRIVLPDEDSTVTWGTFRFAESGSRIRIYYTSDYYKATVRNIPDMTVTVKLDNGETHTYRDSVMVHSLALGTPACKEFLIPGDVTGSGSITVSATNNALQLVKGRVEAVNYQEEAAKLVYPGDSQVLWIGSADEVIGGEGTPRIAYQPTSTNYANGTACRISDTNDHTFLYKDRTFTEAVTKVNLKLGTSSSYSNTRINIRVNSPTAEPVASVDVASYWYGKREADIWYAQTLEIDLSQAIPAGKHDIYIEHEGNYKNPLYPASGFHNPPYGVSDFYFAAFHN